MMLPFIKVSCILVSTVGLSIASTPPHAPPAENEKTKSTNLEVLLKQRSASLVCKSYSWGISLAEAAVLVAQYAPNHACSNFVLSHLILPGGAAERIHVSPSFFIGALMATLGGFVRYKCYQALGRMFTFEMSIRKDHVLVTSGPYGIVRHPGYTGILLAVSGALLMHGSEGSWVRESGVLKTTVMRTFTGFACGLAATITFGLLRRMSKEDEALHRLAGKEWEDWARRVPYKLIPFIY